MVKPPFDNRGSALAFCCLTLSLILLPALLCRIGLPDRKQLYRGVGNVVGTPANSERTVFDDPRNADVLFVGSSPLTASIVPDTVSAYFEDKLKRPVVVKVLDSRWDGPDIEYALLRDYLASHKPKLIVFEVPNTPSISNRPHRYLSSYLRFGDFEDFATRIGISDQLAIYSEDVVRGPRELLDYVRANELAPTEGSDADRESLLDERFRERSLGRSFVPESPLDSSSKPVSPMPLTSAPVKESSKGFTPSPYLLDVLGRISNLARSNGIRLALIDVPLVADYGSNTVSEMLDLPSIFGPDRDLVAVSFRGLFGDIPRDQVGRFYGDSLHLNGNGARLYDSRVLPALYNEYERTNTQGS